MWRGIKRVVGEQIIVISGDLRIEISFFFSDQNAHLNAGGWRNCVVGNKRRYSSLRVNCSYLSLFVFY